MKDWDWLTLLTLAIAFLGCGVAAHIFLRRRNYVSKLLAGYVLVLAAGLAEPLVFPLIGRTAGDLWGGFSLLYGPFLFLFVKNSLELPAGSVRIDYRHFLPFLLYILFILFSVLMRMSAVPEMVEFITYELLFMQIFIYCFKSGSIFRRNRLEAQRPFSEITEMNRSFLRIMVAISSVLFATSFGFTHLLIFWKIDFPFKFQIIQLGLSLLIFVIALLNTESMERHQSIAR